MSDFIPKAYLFRNGWNRLKRFIAWFPIIWRDEDWDSAYLYEIMRFKISRIRKELEAGARHVGYENDIRNMKIAEELLKRQSFSDFYHKNDYRNIEFCKCTDEMFSDWINSENIYISPFCEWCSGKYQIKRAITKEKEDYDFLWKHMRKESRKWWT